MATKQGEQRPLKDEIDAVLASLKRLGNKRTLEGMARYAITADQAFGVPVGEIRKLAKDLKPNRKAGGDKHAQQDAVQRNHELAAALWETGWYEARMLAAFLDEPGLVTPAQMDRWAKDFDSWAICDTACFHLFDRTPHAFAKVTQWAKRRDEFVKRAAFALLASLAGHDKTTGDGPFIASLTLIERAADDERNFVKKGVSWALRGIGHRSPPLHAEAIKLAERLAASSNAAARWVGKDALRDITRPAVIRRLKAKG
ncbi:MAG: hypothetical protein QOD75_406 [Blastocatellia bacterium]|jgi:3-methyladenine DNA glycosylase AlkD|nr:hypothetical protein [Blastocatellia bacterium]